MTTLVPADLELYRSLLPEQFDMPDQPLVVVTVADYYDVTLPLVPYREGYVLLQCKYQGRTGWYTYTMPVDDKTANDGGRAIGFNKYVADEITLEEQDGIWTGRVVHGGRTVMEIVFTATGEPVTATGGGRRGLSLQPPAAGRGTQGQRGEERGVGRGNHGNNLGLGDRESGSRGTVGRALEPGRQHALCGLTGDHRRLRSGVDRAGVRRRQNPAQEALQDLAQEQLGAFAAGIVEELSRGGLFNDDAFIHEHHAVRYLAREAHLVSNDNHGHAVPRQRLHHF